MAIQVEIEGYEQLEQIGVGGMAAVYRARRSSIDKTVAIKVLFPYLATDAEFIDRFQREARSAASISHENIVNVIDCGESNGSFYIVMDYYDGHTLEALMLERPGLPTDIAVQVVLEVAIGLEAAHARDIVHRDIKPANIIFTSQGGIKIADFGLARKADAISVTQEGKVIGTPAYMSPEQAAGRPIGPASDVFSLGVVAYELLSRRKPFEGRTYSEVLERIQTWNPPTLAHVNPLIDADLEAIVARMLAKNESERYSDAHALVADLEAAMDRLKIPRDRRRLAAYARDPQAYEASFQEKVVTESLSRGSFFMQKGESHFDDAALEFRRILFVDPANERARKNLDRIHSKQGGANRTIAIDAMQALPGNARTIDAAPADGSGSSRPRRGVPSWVYGAGAGALLLVAVVWWLNAEHEPAMTEQARPAEEPSQAATLDANGAGVLSLHDGENVGRAADTTRTEISRPTRKPVPAPVKKDPVQIAKPVKDTQDTRADNTRTSQGTEPRRAASEPEKAARTGSLSVFFLGGVGEITVDGRPFGHQPPFEAVSLAAGTYRVACRMAGDTEPREVTIRIVPGVTTTIEYERGGDPVVTTSL